MVAVALPVEVIPGPALRIHEAIGARAIEVEPPELQSVVAPVDRGVLDGGLRVGVVPDFVAALVPLGGLRALRGPGPVQQVQDVPHLLQVARVS